MTVKVITKIDLNTKFEVQYLKYLQNCALQCKQFVLHPNQAKPLSLPSHTEASILFEINTFPV